VHDALEQFARRPVVDKHHSVRADVRIDVGSSTASAMNTATGFAEPLVHDTPPPFHELCARIHDRISAFLDAKDAPERLKGVQEQTRVALRVIEEALARYRWVVRDVNRKLHEADMRLKPA
jgi:FAD synthetase